MQVMAEILLMPVKLYVVKPVCYILTCILEKLFFGYSFEWPLKTGFTVLQFPGQLLYSSQNFETK